MRGWVIAVAVLMVAAVGLAAWASEPPVEDYVTRARKASAA